MRSKRFLPIIEIFAAAFFQSLEICAAAEDRQAGDWDESLPFPGGGISAAQVQQSGGGWILRNSAIGADFAVENGSPRLAGLENFLTGEKQAWTDANLFTIHLADKALPSSAMKLVDGPRTVSLKGDHRVARLAGRFDGQTIEALFADESTGLRVTWTAILRDGANYVRQELAVSSTKAAVVEDIEMIRANVPGAKLMGYTDGSPVVAGNWFFGMEHPMAKTSAGGANGWDPADMAARRFSRDVVKLAPGEMTVRFDYKSGNHRIDVASVALLKDGKVLSEDVHDGFSGHATGKNIYMLRVPDGVTTAALRVTLGGIPQETDSHGVIVVKNGELAEATSMVVSSMPRRFVLAPGVTWTISTQIGVAREGGLRRAFACYLQRERAHPYRQYWHYNSWYDLNIGRNDNPDPLVRMSEAPCLDVINAFGRELFEKRGVGLNGFVWDDGWDDWNSLWQFHKGFPNGFAKLKEAAAKQGAGMGAWLSPWGGYGGSHDMRVKFGKEKGYETNPGGFSLGGEKYFAAFRDTCLKMIRDYNQNYFKFDGIGGGMYATGAPASIAPDLDGLVRVIGDLRKANPDVFINCTVGTWASPYWTFFADSVWRQGEDCSFSGKGNNRERWINYKDSLVYDRFVSRSPLFPVNSLMYHGVLLGPTANPGLMPPPSKDPAGLRHEIRMAAGYASGLGELYITPALMTPGAWDDLAECIRWARAKQSVVVDSHWIGGDPRKNEVYGFAAWHPHDGGVLTLRNPDDKPQSFSLKIADAFELPTGSGTRFEFRSPWKSDASRTPVKTTADEMTSFTLQPFEVLTLETTSP